jgi:hypothetical protein
MIKDFKTFENENYNKIEALKYFNELPENFDEIVSKRIDMVGSLDGAFYFSLGEQTTIDINEDEDIYEELLDLIIDKWPELEF